MWRFKTCKSSCQTQQWKRKRFKRSREQMFAAYSNEETEESANNI